MMIDIHRMPVVGFAIAAALGLCVVVLPGCDDAGSEPIEQPIAPRETVDTKPQWQELSDAIVLPADAPNNNKALADAIDRARKTLHEARTRWTQADETDRLRWAVKWVAPLDNGEVEYVWVHPTHWSPFRVEGVLLNEPVHALLIGASSGDAVSFPDEEICDWIHLPRPGTNAPAEGGFTNDALLQTKESP